jgi:hypothetical protein
MADATKSNRAAEAAVAAHYALLLGIKSPWPVRRVDLKLASNRVEVDEEHDPRRPWRVRSASGVARAAITRRNGNGGTWT